MLRKCKSRFRDNWLARPAKPTNERTKEQTNERTNSDMVASDCERSDRLRKVHLFAKGTLAHGIRLLRSETYSKVQQRQDSRLLGECDSGPKTSFRGRPGAAASAISNDAADNENR